MKKNWMLASILALTITGGGILAMGSGHTVLHHLKSQQNQNKLTAQNRDALVAEVESLKANLRTANRAPGTRGEEIPDGAVMAFDLAQCPAGWTVYNEAKDKFIMGAQYNNDLKATGGTGSIKLTVGQLPPHSHYMFGSWHASTSNWVEDEREWTVSPYSNTKYQDGNDWYAMRTVYGKAYMGRTSSVGNGDPINILPPHIKLLYCKKGGTGSRELENYVPPKPKVAPVCWSRVNSCERGQSNIWSSKFILDDVIERPGGRIRLGRCRVSRTCENDGLSTACFDDRYTDSPWEC